MAKKRLIPKLQMQLSSNQKNRFVVVITRNFSAGNEIGDPVSQAKIFQDQGADELIFINIDSEHSSITNLAEVVFNISKEIFMPICVGGGIKKLDDFRLLLSNGADKICINSIALENPLFITAASEKFGAQCVVISIDYKKINGELIVYKNNGKTATNYNPLTWAKEVEKLGAGEILLTCIDNDGVKSGLDVCTAKIISDNISIPLIISGGCGEAQHFSDGFILGNVDAVAAGTFFAHRDQNFMQTRAQIKNAGVNIRSKK
jgi:cyclase